MILPSEQLIEMDRRMLRVRFFEERAVELVAKGAIPGAIHTAIGQEATVVGACMALRDTDYITGTHRSHGHPIAKGAELGPLMAELFGKQTGVCKGKGGSMHLADFSIGSLGETAIVGSAIPVATGAGLSAKMRGTDQVCLCFFGDGAANEGAFHESLNLASIWNLPVVYLCENNLYAFTTPISYAIAVENVADRAVAYSMPGVVVDGQDPLAVHEAVSEAVARARAGHGPSLVEAKTYRYREHAEFGGLDMGSYRSADELADWKARDPIPNFRAKLIAEKVLSELTADGLEHEVRAEVDTAVIFAQSSSYPSPEEVFTDLYTSTVPVL